MSSGFWEQVVADGLAVPDDRSLVEMTEELTRMLGDPDPEVRDGIAFPALATWIDEGIYDDLLVGLGDGMTHGLAYGLGLTDDDSVFRRSFSALVLTECIDRSTSQGLAGPDVLLRWGDRVMGWLAREQDFRDFVPGKGWAHALAHGADALAALARSPYLGRLELTVILDVIADRLLADTDAFWVCGEDDRLALATVQVLQRNILGLDVLEPWVARVAAGARGRGTADQHPFRVAGNVQGFLRSLHLQLALGAERPSVRTDLLLTLIVHLRRINPAYFPPPRAH
ncbi:MAG: DUF2785 domain-containing protein [Propionibacteriales bacterium]|nr:DUF2785 domain-containing protein [Propionibacteriales bacterium]